MTQNNEAVLDNNDSSADNNAVEIPTRFTYYKNLSSPGYKLLTKVGSIIFGVKNARMPDETVQLHAESLLRTDELSDNVVKDVYCEEGGGAKYIKTVFAEGLDKHPDAPESLKAFYNSLHTEPEWLDWERIQNGIHTSHRVGRPGLYGLAMLGLLAGYSNSDLTKPLVATGALTGDSTFNRINFTSAFWMEVTNEGALKPGSKGFETAVHVRLKHALVRRHIRNKDSWNTKDWGVPINLSDSAITNVGFSSMLVLSSRLLGFRITNKEFEDVLHLWRYIGHLLGDDDRLIPKTTEEAIQTLGFISAGNDNMPDKDSITLANDLIDSFKQKGRGTLLETTGFFKNFFYRAYAQLLIPPEQHKNLKLPSSYGLFLLILLIQTPIILLLDNIRHYTGIDSIFRTIGRRGQNIFIKNRFRIANSQYKNLSSNESIMK